jgi:acetyltransferase
MILVAEREDGKGEREIMALGQLTRLHGTNEAEFAILVSDHYQRTGLGTELLSSLLDFARDEKMERVIAEILPENEGMKRVSLNLGFKLQWDRESGVVQAAIDL